MSNFMMVDCLHCGQQTTIDIEKRGDTCLFCGKPAKLKEVIMQEKQEKIEKQYSDMHIRERGRYIKAHLAEIVEDIKAMDGAAVMAKWGFVKSTYSDLRKLHVPELIGKPWTIKADATSGAEQKPKDADVSLTEHERYLILVGWQEAVRELLHIVHL